MEHSTTQAQLQAFRAGDEEKYHLIEVLMPSRAGLYIIADTIQDLAKKLDDLENKYRLASLDLESEKEFRRNLQRGHENLQNDFEKLTSSVVRTKAIRQPYPE
jgi:hypothetical protein